MRIIYILAFFLALGTAIPLIDSISPWSTSYKNPSNTSGFNEALVLNATGCNSPGAYNGTYACSGSLSGATSTGGGGFFGTIVNTVAVFGNFFAGVTFLLTLAKGVFLPGTYVFAWLGGGGNLEVALAVSGMVQALVMIAYGEGFFYIVTGRWLE